MDLFHSSRGTYFLLMNLSLSINIPDFKIPGHSTQKNLT